MINVVSKHTNVLDEYYRDILGGHSQRYKQEQSFNVTLADLAVLLLSFNFFKPICYEF